MFSLFVFFFPGCQFWEPEQPPTLRIGVMLPYSGEYASNWDSGLDWAVENINMAGGVAGYNLELVKKDIAKNDLKTVAEDFVADETIKAVIGPLTSSEVYDVAPIFINGKKLLMAPVATAANISRAFAAYDYFWRLSEPDISQAKTLMLLAQSDGARRISLITEESQYGASFEDWFGFFATELGLEVAGIRVVDPGDLAATEQAWNNLIEKQPDAVIAAINSPAQNAALVRAYRNNGQQARLLMSDAAVFQAMVDDLGDLAENLEGTTITSDPSSGFDISYHVKHDKYPSAFISHMYDAVMLLGLALEASGGEGGEELVEALKKVVAGREGNSGWHRDELSAAIRSVRKGIFPNISGASGALDYDELYFTDVTSTTYGHWRVDAGQFVITDFYTTDGEGRISSTSAAYRTIAEKRQQFSSSGTWPHLPPKEGLYAFLMATSEGWQNYRHQADVLHTYQLMKNYGLHDDQIILILADDLAQSPSNQLPGVIRNVPEGENLYEDVEIDYNLQRLTPEMLANILEGHATEETPVVLPSSEADNIFFFTSGHGTPDGMVFEAKEHASLTPQYWQSVFSTMHENQKFRQVFWALEACYSGKIGEAIQTPGVMLMTGANPYETSKAHFYDTEIKAWLADKFAYSINNAIAENPDIFFNDLYERSYTYVNGSHVSFYNYQNFGNIYELTLKDFVAP